MSITIENEHYMAANVISDICMKVSWTDFTRKGHSKTDSLVATLNIAKNEQDILCCIDRVCKRYGVISPSVSISDFEELAAHSDECMKVIRQHTQFIAVMALKEMDYKFKSIKERKGNDVLISY